MLPPAYTFHRLLIVFVAVLSSLFSAFTTKVKAMSRSDNDNSFLIFYEVLLLFGFAKLQSLTLTFNRRTLISNKFLLLASDL